MKKKLFSGFFVVAFFLTAFFNFPAAKAAELPKAYWSLNDRYNAAVSSNNYTATIENGVSIINLFTNSTKTEQVQNILATKTYGVAFAYFNVYDYENALKYFNMYIPYGKALGWEDGVIIAEAFSEQLPATLEVYRGSESPVKTYGVKNEPNGVLYGETAEPSRSSESMMLLYIEYGDTNIFGYARTKLSQARRNGQAVELALNFPREGNTARAIRANDSYLRELHSLLADYTNIPIYLRIGAEFNIWSVKCTPSEFIPAYRIIADSVSDLPNISKVWSMANNSTWKNAAWPYVADDFYPGDWYVDWVGVSCYTNKYFGGSANAALHDRVCYNIGEFADPVLLVRGAVETYGGRKPIMITECGAAYETNGAVKEYHDDWAAARLREMYSYIPMVYPEVKLIAYFNKKMTNEMNYYDLTGSDRLRTAYNEMVQKPWFVQGGDGKAQMFFRKLDGTVTVNGSTKLYSYQHMVGEGNVTVSYYLDGTLVGQSSSAPYETELGSVSGTHTLTVTATGSSGRSTARTYTVNGAIAQSTPAPKIPVEKPTSVEGFNDTYGLDSGQRKAANYMIQNGIMDGYDDNTLKPTGSITRAEFTAMVCRTMRYSLRGNCTFNDARNHWSSQYINACVNAKIINGVGNNNFATDDRLTLNQAAKMVTIMYDYATEETDYPRGFISAAEKNNVLDNVTAGRADDPVSRIDVAMMMYNAHCRGRGSASKDAWQDTAESDATPPKDTVQKQRTNAAWSEWMTELPKNIDSDSFYIEQKDQYCTRSRVKEYYTTGKKQHSGNYVDMEITFGEWSGWTDNRQTANDYLEVDTRNVPDNNGANKTQYRSRPIFVKYIYWDWSAWSPWGSWSDSNNTAEESEDVQTAYKTRTVYRYKER